MENPNYKVENVDIDIEKTDIVEGIAKEFYKGRNHHINRELKYFLAKQNLTEETLKDHGFELIMEHLGDSQMVFKLCKVQRSLVLKFKEKITIE